MSDYHSADKHQIAFDDKFSIWRDESFREAWILAESCFTRKGHSLLNFVDGELQESNTFESFIRLMANESQHTGSMSEALSEVIWKHYHNVLTPKGMNVISRLCTKDLIVAISVLTEMPMSEDDE